MPSKLLYKKVTMEELMSLRASYFVHERWAESDIAAQGFYTLNDREGIPNVVGDPEGWELIK